MIRAAFKTSLRALGHRNYRLFFWGQAVSLIGTWMTRLASSWLVYRLTNDPAMLGVVNFASLAPSFLLGPFAGVLVDRAKNLQRLIFLTQLAGMFQSVGLVLASAISAAPATTIASLIALNILQGIINAFDMPARQAFLPRMITDKKDLSNGIALNSSLFNAARLVGPAIAGALIAVVGETWCFGIDALSYIGVLWAVQAMRVREDDTRPKEGQRLFASLAEGLRYAWSYEPIRAVLLLIAGLSFFGLPHTVLLPVYAREILGGGPQTLGWLTAASGLGALLGALRLARRESIVGIGRVIAVAGLLFTSSLLAFAYSHNLPLSFVLLLGTGFGMLSQSASCNTILQSIVDPDKRGRVTSLYLTAFVGMAPFGGLVTGYFASRVGAPLTLAVCAGFCGLCTLQFALRLPRIRAAVRERTDIQTAEA